VLPLLTRLLEPIPGARYLDLGCGEGQGMRHLAAGGAGTVVGCDLNPHLLARAATTGSVVRGRLPDLGWAQAGAFDGGYAVLVLEHLDDIRRFFAEARRVIRPGGTFVVIANHPAFTAPGAGAVFDSSDGSVYWEWGPYFEESAAPQPAGDGPAGSRTIVFHHRPLGVLLDEAAAAGWSLERFVELGVGEGTAGRDSLLALQRHIPRLLGVRWRAA
jgi:SAM-dependent methyltransferase